MLRTGWVFLLLLFAPALHALDVTVAGSFTIAEVTRPGGRLRLPQERKYNNIRLLDKATYDFVSSCASPCIQNLGGVTPAVYDVRPARTRENMWIVQVSFNRAWLITFLVFKKGENWRITAPKHFTFLSNALRAQTHRAIKEAVLQDKG